MVILKMEENTFLTYYALLFQKSLKTTEMQKKICAVYGEGAVTDGTCQKWFVKFRAGGFSLDDAPQSGTPVQADRDQIEISRTINVIPCGR